VQQLRRLVEGGDQDVEAAVVVVVAHDQPAVGPRGLETRAGLVGDVAEERLRGVPDGTSSRRLRFSRSRSSAGSCR
jgi:hypothetical protein